MPWRGRLAVTVKYHFMNEEGIKDVDGVVFDKEDAAASGLVIVVGVVSQLWL